MGGRPPPARPPKSATAAAASRARSPEPRPSRSRAGGGAMACAGLLTVCLIRPPAPEPPRPPAPAAGPAGHALFQDMMVSSHLKNSRITLPMGFSAPGSCESCSAALMGIPLTIWKQRSCVVSRPMGALVFRDLWADYFSEHLGVYRPVLAALESLNCAVLAAMDTTKLEYERASKVDQFVTRFLLRETVSQLQALQSSLEGASDTLEAQAHGPWSDEERVEVQSRPRGSRRAGRRALRSVGRSPTWSPGFSDTGRSSEAEMQWRLQINRLQELIDQLECKAPRLEPLHEEEFTKGPNSHILVAQRQVQVAEEALQDFHHALCCYVDFTGAQSHCLQHQQSACSKAFQRILIDHLRAPDTLTTVFFPASWWIMNNN
ncbi:N-terminal EF-hand calcium-binding protein 3 isoform X4 [Hippopotamus amphibius kiboko]|uniref:N-terminal EF-hand calcium-binding protein 3 isoform X4 n=1 Tax=Hippopotamus amphibius kiboko TaxID=575201 RepID=UPI00259297E0|nr:N-terminal EF-hand calcium-binding protein 3 isoform X4 [Hippopotamus amphibius kiboko]